MGNCPITSTFAFRLRLSVYCAVLHCVRYVTFNHFCPCPRACNDNDEPIMPARTPLVARHAKRSRVKKNKSQRHHGHTQRQPGCENTTVSYAFLVRVCAYYCAYHCADPQVQASHVGLELQVTLIRYQLHAQNQIPLWPVWKKYFRASKVAVFR